ncbi:type II toxin-antitoxin system VapC family toxin [Spirosoma rhododendri]|uniref:Type II toxin-antitoxin system VapC family toxin n=1 Tax=Spirosoma rhododendri TaxID=2728024 RepID=A0A7L5DNH1_9BACT|nr:type II toxin-antitoxin system VapC family toxin [Spirosoma rhododendri]QJD79645.1 type II toxin-antitoxin system VapC family toxin [Spirosoma rhododendri]
MDYLIDTQILIWFELNGSELKPAIREMLIDGRNSIWVAQLSLFEIAIKQTIGKLPDLRWDTITLANQLEQDGFLLLPLKTAHIAVYNSIPLLANHRDPFDRLLMASAIAEGLTIISADEQFRRYVPQIQLVEA